MSEALIMVMFIAVTMCLLMVSKIWTSSRLLLSAMTAAIIVFLGFPYVSSLELSQTYRTFFYFVVLIYAAYFAVYAAVVAKREWTWTGAYVALGCFAAAMGKHEIWLRMLIDPDYEKGAGSVWKFYFWPPTILSGVILIATGTIALFAMAGALQRPRFWPTLALFPLAFYQIVMAGWSVQAWIINGTASVFTIGTVSLPPWLGTLVFLVLIDLPFVVALPWGLSRLLRPNEGEAAKVMNRFSTSMGAMLVAMALLTSAVFVASLRTSRLAGSGSETYQIFVALALAALMLLVFGAILDLRQKFLLPAIAIIEGIRKDASLETAVAENSPWRPLLHSVQTTRNELDQSRAQLEGFFNHVPCAMSLHELDGSMVLCSKHTSLTYGITKRGVPAHEMASLSRFWPEFEKLFEATSKVASTGQPQRIVTPFLTNGTPEPRMYDLSVFPILDADGRVVQVGSLGIDVTDQIAAKAETDKAQKTLKAFFDNIPAMTFIISRDRKYVSVNSYASDVVGMDFLSPENLIGKPDIANTPAHWHPVIAEAHRAVVEEGRMVTNDPSIDLPSGTYDLSVSRFPIRNAAGEVEFVGGLLFDRTAEKTAARQIAASQEALHQSEKLAALGQLLAGVAHELNNPLTVLVGRSAILAEKLKGTQHERAIADLREAADRSNRIVRTFLAMARQEAPRRRQVQINDAVDAAFDMVAYGIRSAGIEVERQLDPSVREVAADEDQLVQVFTNLLINAQHAMEDHDGPRTLRMTTRMDKDAVVAEIADSGPGIPPDVASRIFEPFFTTKDVGQGTGMGLAMARGMIEEHDGTLTHGTSGLGGALFTVRLPIGASDELTPTETPPEDASPATVGRALVVDDEVSIRRLMVEVLEGDGIACTEAGDGEEALRLLATTHFDLIFSDIRMPGMDGIRLRERIASDHPDMLHRLAFMSGDVLQRDASRYASLAGHVIIDKPFNPAQIRRHVADLLGKEGPTL